MVDALLRTSHHVFVLQVLKPHVMPEEWTKFQSYATRVREIGLFPDSAMHPSAWTFLAIQCGGSPFLPRLHDLDAHDLSLDDLSPLFVLLSPSLHSLSLSFKEEGDYWGNVWNPCPVAIVTLPHVVRLVPNLKGFHMPGRRSFTQKHLAMLQSFDGLTELSLGSGFLFNGTMLHQLSTMTSLRALCITVAHHGGDSTDLGPLSHSLRSLHKLRLGGDLEDIVAIILACHFPLLDSLALQVQHSPNPTSFGTLFASVCQHHGLPTFLTSFGCEFCDGIKVQRQETLLQYFAPLLSFSMIEDFELIFYDTRPVPSVCDEDLIRLGDAWPNLQRLNVRQISTSHSITFSWDYGRETLPDIQHPTVFGLTELTRRCPILQYIHLVAIDASLLPQTDAALRLGHPLRELIFDHVHNTALSSEKRCATAEVLYLAFPRLDIALSKAECGRLNVRPDTYSQWKRILLLVWAQQYRSSRDLGLLDSNFGFEAQWEVSKEPEKSLADLDAALLEAYSSDPDPYWESVVPSPECSDTDEEWTEPSESDS